MAYPQAPIEMDMYIELPTGIHTKHGNSMDHVLKLLAKYLQAKASRSHMEQLSRNQATGDQFQAVTY
jgi:hypothetical protein